MNGDESNRVSVTWKWLAVTLVMVLIGAFGWDHGRAWSKLDDHDKAIQMINERLLQLPTRNDVEKLDAKLERLLDRSYETSPRKKSTGE